jgi:toxin-antitoxin system PIN domain toxin
MVILDSNILLYGTMPIFRQHEAVKTWLERALSVGEDIVGITWQVAASFLRISTNRRIFDQPLELRNVQDLLNDLFDNPMVSIVGPTDDHWQIYSRILTDLNLSGDIVMDARIAAIALEHNASVASCDRDFRRFSDYVKIIDPTRA